jgi:hypothetical protein
MFLPRNPCDLQKFLLREPNLDPTKQGFERRQHKATSNEDNQTKRSCPCVENQVLSHIIAGTNERYSQTGKAQIKDPLEKGQSGCHIIINRVTRDNIHHYKSITSRARYSNIRHKIISSSLKPIMGLSVGLNPLSFLLAWLSIGKLFVGNCLLLALDDLPIRVSLFTCFLTAFFTIFELLRAASLSLSGATMQNCSLRFNHFH